LDGSLGNFLCGYGNQVKSLAEIINRRLTTEKKQSSHRDKKKNQEEIELVPVMDCDQIQSP
jgi:hypothetical protein